MSTDYPNNGRLSRWEEIAEGLAIVGVQALEEPFPFEPGQYATLGLIGPEGKLVQRPMSITPRPTAGRVRVLHPARARGRVHPAPLGAKLGDPINIKGPKGKFLLQEDGHRSSRGERDRPGAVHEHDRDAPRARAAAGHRAAARGELRPRPRLAGGAQDLAPRGRRRLSAALRGHGLAPGEAPTGRD